VISQTSIPKGLEKILQKQTESLFPQTEIQVLFLNHGEEKSE
jgi:hypothetical protein